MKAAMIWTTTRGYMPGTNAILNAFEYYKFPREIDRYVLVFDDNNWTYKDPYWQQWPDVHALNLDGSFRPGMNAYWYLVFADIKLATELLDEYDVVLLWGADDCIVNDFSEYFDVCHRLDRMILGHNEQGVQHYGNLSPKEPYGHTWDVPFADIPFFVPRSCKPMLLDMLRMQTVPGNMCDRMDSLNYALRDSGHKPFQVSGMLWVMNVTQWAPVVDAGNGYLFVHNQRMNSFHRKYWSANFCEVYMPNAGEVSRRNHLVFNKQWNFFNRNFRVKWEEGLDVWNG